ncbi:MAG: hypothetical protein A2020_05915 [Lentisphaerae bacterium GWF2_45_14]|nr:MAG: hypothetical protein A2020_05915 [Lentisphaerae bacterium GWF2_45_14]
MHSLALTGASAATVGILLGLISGFVLVRSELVWEKTFTDFFMLKNGKIVSIILFSICIGTFLFFLLKLAGAVNCHIKPSSFWASVIGGVIFGAGVFICKQVPITSFALFGTGRVYALWALAGMLLAIPAVRFCSGFLSDTVYALNPPFHYEKTIDVYMPGVLAVGIISFIALLLSALFYFMFSGVSASGDGKKSASSGKSSKKTRGKKGK